MKFENTKILKFDFLENEKDFWSGIKAFFLVWEVLSFRLKRQTSKNVADKTFKACVFFLMKENGF